MWIAVSTKVPFLRTSAAAISHTKLRLQAEIRRACSAISLQVIPPADCSPIALIQAFMDDPSSTRREPIRTWRDDVIGGLLLLDVCKTLHGFETSLRREGIAAPRCVVCTRAATRHGY